jgi:hypothetical protein
MNAGARIFRVEDIPVAQETFMNINAGESLPVKGSKRIKRRPRLMTPLITKTKQVAASANSHVDECRQINAHTGQGLDFSVGTRVFFEADGFSGSAVIDDLMPDGSVIWVWPDDATGRKMLCIGEAVIVVALEGQSLNGLN